MCDTEGRDPVGAGGAAHTGEEGQQEVAPAPVTLQWLSESKTKIVSTSTFQVSCKMSLVSHATQNTQEKELWETEILLAWQTPQQWGMTNLHAM